MNEGQHSEGANSHQQEGEVDRDHHGEHLHFMDIRAGARHELACRRPVIEVEREAANAAVELHADVRLYSV